MTKDNDFISKETFMEELYRYKKGSVTRRHFLNVTGLGAATAVVGAAMPSVFPSPAFAGDIGDRVILATWPNYHDPSNFEAFTEATGAHVQVNVFGSNEEMLAKLQAGATGWDVYVPTNYTISTYVEEDLIEPLDTSRMPNYDGSAFDARYAEAGSVDGKLYAVPKDWGSTGIAFNTAHNGGKPISSWKEFFDLAMDSFTGR
ncbi:MAG: extracellular solute-binding protein, partial [Rhodobacteraceae bacterium]|nr:extracellular solute-binding protein [Paracoccaceae bacterium]